MINDYGYLKEQCDTVYDVEGKRSKRVRIIAANEIMEAIRWHLRKDHKLPRFLADYLEIALNNQDLLALGFKKAKPTATTDSSLNTFKLAFEERFLKNNPHEKPHGDTLDNLARKYGVSRTKVYKKIRNYQPVIDAYEKKYGMNKMPDDEELAEIHARFVKNLYLRASEAGWEDLEKEYGMSRDSLNYYRLRILNKEK